MILVALSAVVLFAWEEFQDGFPPRFVIRGIPARIAKLKPGMSRDEVREILGLEKSWLLGGTNARYIGGIEGGLSRFECYLLRSWKLGPLDRGTPPPVDDLGSSAMIYLTYINGGNAGDSPVTSREESDQLAMASLIDGQRTIAKMPEQ